jgi:PAS domain S-box-containing protein
LTELLTRIRNTLEVCLLYQKLEDRNEELEARVQERTAQLRESEARFRSLTELASDWYWEQDETGALTKVTGPVLDMLGMRVEPLDPDVNPEGEEVGGWDASQHAELKARIAAREPFLDFILCRTHGDGSVQTFQISGEPMFNRGNKFIGYRGIGLEISSRH